MRQASGYTDAVRLCIVSAKYPFGPKEPFLDTELRTLAPNLDAVTIFPTSPRDARRGFEEVPAEVIRLPLAGPRTLWLAARAFARRPLRALSTVAALLGERYPPA